MTDIVTDADIIHVTGLFGKTAEGLLWVNAHYTWEPSGPTFKTKSFMRGSLFHDALYQMMEEGLLPKSYKDQADKLLIKICLEDGMWPIRTRWIYEGLEHFGKVGWNTSPILTAP